MLKCVIVDDEKGAIDVLSGYVRQTPDLECVAAFRDSVEALNFLIQNPVDILFLDIDMPKLSGLQLTELVHGKRIRIVFCTAYSEYAVESYEHDAADYLLKPIAYERFLKAVEKVRKIIRTRDNNTGDGISSKRKLFIKSGTKIHQLDTQDLLFMKKDGHYIVFHTTGGEIMSRMNMEELLSSLPQDNYARIHKSYVVAIDKIDTIEKHEVFIRGKEIPIGGRFRDDFLDRIAYSGK
ncbi:LytR/AlgR family response regulator transcription factor [bacterium]